MMIHRREPFRYEPWYLASAHQVGVHHSLLCDKLAIELPEDLDLLLDIVNLVFGAF